MNFFQLQTVNGGNFSDKFMLNRVQTISYMEGKMTVRFKDGSSEQYVVEADNARAVMDNWEQWCASQSVKVQDGSFEKLSTEMSESFQKIMKEVDAEFKAAVVQRMDKTLSHVDALFSKLAPRYEALEQIASTFEKYLGEGKK